MHPSAMLEKKLKQHNLSPQKFARISGMPLTEIKGLLEGRLPFTILRAYHLAAVFDTQPDVWLSDQDKSDRNRSIVSSDL